MLRFRIGVCTTNGLNPSRLRTSIVADQGRMLIVGGCHVSLEHLDVLTIGREVVVVDQDDLGVFQRALKKVVDITVKGLDHGPIDIWADALRWMVDHE